LAPGFDQRGVSWEWWCEECVLPWSGDL